MTEHAGPFDLVARQTLAAVWYEASSMVHGDVPCLYDRCPHSIDLLDLLDAVARVYPALYEERYGQEPLIH